jgi:Zn-dependent M28 family amino/carboxypeptidase
MRKGQYRPTGPFGELLSAVIHRRLVQSALTSSGAAFARRNAHPIKITNPIPAIASESQAVMIRSLPCLFVLFTFDLGSCQEQTGYGIDLDGRGIGTIDEPAFVEEQGAVHLPRQLGIVGRHQGGQAFGVHKCH